MYRTETSFWKKREEEAVISYAKYFSEKTIDFLKERLIEETAAMGSH